MLSKKLEEAINAQINAEFWSAFMYLSMSAWFENQGLKGMANWMRVQYLEETSHAMKIYDFIISRGGEAKLAAIDAVPTEWKSITEVFEETYKHECLVTEMIHNCYNVAAAEKDHASTNMLQWFIDEQVEEEQNVIEILDQLKLIGDKGQGVYMLNKELASRVFVDATQSAI